MRRGVIVIEHSDNDTEETTEFRHPSPSEPLVSAAEYPFPLEKAPRPLREVLSYEFWVLSCPACGHARRGGWSIWFIWFVSFVWFVWFTERTEQTKQTKETK
jgi:hypothetical protein